MPSGKPIKWQQYDELIRTELPKCPITDFQHQHLPHISTKAIGARARKIGVIPGKFHHSKEQIEAMIRGLSKDTPEVVSFLIENRDKMGLRQLARATGVGYATVTRILKKHNIKMSEAGLQRAKEVSRQAGVGRKPWNYGSPLPDEMKKNIGKSLEGDKNAQTGKPRTEEEKRKFKASFRKTGIIKIRAWLASEEGREAAARSLLSTTSTEFRESQSKKISDMILQGKLVISNNHYKKQLMETKKGGTFRTKSTWETKYVEKLENDPTVTEFKYEPMRIPYAYDGLMLYYIPDFLVTYVDGHRELIEIKPERLCSMGKNPAKIAAASKQDIPFRVVTRV